MAHYQIGVIVGSIRKDSLNRKLAHAVQKLAPAEFKFENIPIDDLPLYSQDDDSSQAASVKRMKAQIAASQAILFVTPEYNRSVPGVLKNAIDHASRPYGQSVWPHKPAGMIGISPGTLGTALAQQHLRNILASLDMITMAQPEVFLQAKEGLFDAEGNLSADSKSFLQKWMNQYIAWIKKHTE